MERRFLLVLFSAGWLAAQTAEVVEQPPVASLPKADVRGKIARIQIGHGRGMPFVEVDTGSEPVKVWLGAMRYLMEKNFNPKAGDLISVHGYKRNAEIIAIRVVVNGKTELKLRDEQGWPLWRGPHGHHHGEKR